jgi:hypothetical protein
MQFVLSLFMLRLLQPAEFGAFIFSLIASQLSWGIWSALFCAPLPVQLAAAQADERKTAEAALLSANLIGAITALPLFAMVAALLGLHLPAGVCFALYGALGLLRWFARTYAYVHGRQLRTAASDLVYSTGTLLTFALGALVFRWDAQTACYAGLLGGITLALIPFGFSYARRQAAAYNCKDLWRYGAIWRKHTRWALLGVLTTEATANAHAYIITLLQGPHAFAPIAASALLLRPVNVAQTALAEFEKPQMARLIAMRNWSGLLASKRIFLGALVVIWALTVVAAWALLHYNPYLLFSASYDLFFIEKAAYLWLAVAAIRLVQVPSSTVLGAAGEFRALAFASIWSSLPSVLLTAALVYALGTLWSILGVAAGAILFLVRTELTYRAWLTGVVHSAPCSGSRRPT